MSWLDSRTSLGVHWVDFPELAAKPTENAQAIVEFLNRSLDAGAMTAEVNAALPRNRRENASAARAVGGSGVPIMAHNSA